MRSSRPRHPPPPSPSSLLPLPPVSSRCGVLTPGTGKCLPQPVWWPGFSLKLILSLSSALSLLVEVALFGKAIQIPYTSLARLSVLNGDRTVNVLASPTGPAAERPCKLRVCRDPARPFYPAAWKTNAITLTSVSYYERLMLSPWLQCLTMLSHKPDWFHNNCVIAMNSEHV